MGERRYSSAVRDLGSRRKVISEIHLPVALFSRTHLTGGWAETRAGLNVVEKKKSYPCLESNPVFQFAARRYTY